MHDPLSVNNGRYGEVYFFPWTVLSTCASLILLIFISEVSFLNISYYWRLLKLMAMVKILECKRLKITRYYWLNKKQVKNMQTFVTRWADPSTAKGKFYDRLTRSCLSWNWIAKQCCTYRKLCSKVLLSEWVIIISECYKKKPSKYPV